MLNFPSKGDWVVREDKELVTSQLSVKSNGVLKVNVLYDVNYIQDDFGNFDTYLLKNGMKTAIKRFEGLNKPTVTVYL